MINVLGYPVGITPSNPVIRWYAVFILIGAVVAVLIANYRAHNDGFKGYDFFLSIFPFLFLAGILGCRIWYIIASWDEFKSPTFGETLLKMIDFRSGGMAIQGGIIFGIVFGVIICMIRRKGTSVLKIMDYVVPTIIIAQTIGRWGNFINQEVFGHFVAADNWSFLPSFISNNMQNGDLNMGEYYVGDKLITVANTGIHVPSGSIAVPLFLVEGMVNIMFYFIITHGLKALLGKHFRDGDSSFAYITAYGIIRMVLEPLRNPAFIMGTSTAESSRKDYKSFIMAIIFIVVGLVLIVLNHVMQYLARKGKFNNIVLLRSIFDMDYGARYIKDDSSQLSKPIVKTKKKKQLSYQLPDDDMDINKLSSMEDKLTEKEKGDENGEQ